MKELRGEQHNNRIVDLLITLFGFGIFIQYFIGELHLFRVFIMSVNLWPSNDDKHES
jgi:hypothetical protein